MAVSLRQLQYLVASAESGTMSAAAQELYVSQSAVSLGLSQLESTVGADLFVRAPNRQLQLTAAGREMLMDARRILSDLDEMLDRVRAQGTATAGKLTVGWYQTLGPMLLPQVVAGFEAAHPEVELHVREGGTDDLCAALLSGELETAVLYDLELTDGLTLFPLTSVRPYVLISPSHPLARHTTVTAAQLSEQDMILYSPPGDYYLGLLQSLGVTSRVRYRFDNYETVRSFAARGLGYTLLHQRQTVRASYEGKPLIIRELADEVRSLQVVLCIRDGARLTARARAFVDFTRELFDAGRPPDENG